MNDLGQAAGMTTRREVRDGTPVYRFDIRLQTADETVFFDL